MLWSIIKLLIDKKQEMDIFLKLILLSPFLFLAYFVLLYIKTRVPFVTTPKQYYNELFKHYKIKEGSVVYELGCGQGDFLFAAEKFKPKKLIGFELSFLHVFYGKIKARFKSSKVAIKYKDFFKADLSDADTIYLFLVMPVLIKTWKKIKREGKPGTVVIVLADMIPNEKYFKKIPTRPQKQKSTFYYLYKL